MAKRSFPSFLLYQDENGRWRWSYADASGNDVAAATASYASREACQRAIRDLQSQGQPAYAFHPAANAKNSKTGGDGNLLDLDLHRAAD